MKITKLVKALTVKEIIYDEDGHWAGGFLGITRRFGFNSEEEFIVIDENNIVYIMNVGAIGRIRKRGPNYNNPYDHTYQIRNGFGEWVEQNNAEAGDLIRLTSNPAETLMNDLRVLHLEIIARASDLDAIKKVIND